MLNAKKQMCVTMHHTVPTVVAQTLPCLIFEKNKMLETLLDVYFGSICRQQHIKSRWLSWGNRQLDKASGSTSVPNWSDIAHALEGSSQQAPAHLPSPFCPVDAEAVLRTVGISVTVVGHSSCSQGGACRHWIADRVAGIATGYLICRRGLF